MGDRTIKLTLAYDGTDFHGWQVQPGMRTVQGVLAEACERILRHPVKPDGAGRTDAGVHARGQVASLTTPSTVPIEKLGRAITSHLPDDVAVVAAEEAPAGFHARFSAKAKWYRYRILDGRRRDPFERRTAWEVDATLDVDRIREAARGLLGTHDFRSFARTDARYTQAEGGPEVTVRTLHGIDALRQGPIMTLDVRGDGFLYNMVRAIAGTLVEVGRGRRPQDFPSRALLAHHRSAAGPTAPPQGLFLMEVVY
jgi:tRNA pseudouridine38-40 synthase